MLTWAESHKELEIKRILHTSPKTTCLPSSHGVGAVVMKNCMGQTLLNTSPYIYPWQSFRKAEDLFKPIKQGMVT